jgi:hypothetical protein
MNEGLRNSIKTLTRIYYDYQRERIYLDGRLGMTKNGEKKKRAPERDMTILSEIFTRREKALAMEELTLHGYRDDNGTWHREHSIMTLVHQHPLWDAFLLHVKGCGETIAAVIISEFDIHKAPHVSNLWSFAGLAPGKDRKKKGEKCPYNQFLRKTLCGILGPAFLKANSPYREYYDNMRNRLEAEDWGQPAKHPSDKKRPKRFHQHRAANRYMVKMFLRDLYVAWRTLEGLEVTEPYQQQYLGHKHHAAVGE